MVLLGNKALWSLFKSVFCRPEQPAVEREHENRDPRKLGHEPAVLFRHPHEAPVEKPEKSPYCVAPDFRQNPRSPFGFVPQKQRAQRGSERERHQRGQYRRGRYRERKLLVKFAGYPSDKRGRHEYAAQDERYRNNRALDLRHGLFGRFVHGKPQPHVALDVFDHHDCVVDDYAYCEHKPEQRQVVYRESEQVHHRKRPDERHRNCKQRNYRRAPVLQE